MKKYSLYKNFIPTEFIIERSYKNELSDKRSVMLLAVLCFMIFPFAISNLSNNENNETSVISNKTKDLTQWNYLINNGFQGKYTDEKAVIIIHNKEDLDELIKDKNISVAKIEHRNDEDYEIEIYKK